MLFKGQKVKGGKHEETVVEVERNKGSETEVSKYLGRYYNIIQSLMSGSENWWNFSIKGQRGTMREDGGKNLYSFPFAEHKREMREKSNRYLWVRKT